MKTLFLLGVLLSHLNAAESTVTSVTNLQAAIKAAKPGDIINLANGIYTNNTLAINTSNITVQAATPGGAILSGTNAITIPADDVTFSGFQFLSGSTPVNIIEVTGNNNTLSHLNFNGYSAQKCVVFKAGSQHNTITYSNFQNKPASAPQGNLIESEADAVIGYHVISHNTCQHMPGRGGDNGNECIRLGEGSQSLFTSRTLVEYNYFEDTGPGDSEAISVKSRENVLRYNTMNKNPNAMFTFRNGDNNVAYGNFFIDSGGIRIKEANSIFCYNNYFERAGIGGTMNAVTYDFVSPNLQNISFFHNTFVDSGLIALASGPLNNTWTNNLIRKSSGNIFSGPYTGITFAGNLYSGTLGVSVPTGMAAPGDLGIALNQAGYYGLTATSPAVNSSFPMVTLFSIPGIDGDYALSLDVAGQTRDARKDVGALEFGATGPVINHPLKVTDAGPSYLQSPIRAFNAASYTEGAVAQDSIITVFASGASVNVIDSKNISRPAQVFFAGQGQINFLLPQGTATGQALFVIGGQGTLVSTATVAASAPGIFTVAGNSTVPAAFYLRVTPDNQRTTDLTFDAALNAIAIPRTSGDQIYLLLYGTGFRNASQVTATANGQAVPVLGAVAQGQFAGLDQANIGPLPANLPTGTITVKLTADGQSANTLTVKLQ